ncbi:hypothetical protein [Delftia lacustris]|nr:hypothetical protein [Delftia lacustris]
MLLAIGLQESNFQYRRQLVGSPPKPVGPARSYWQAELGGGLVRGVRTHAKTKELAAQLYARHAVAATDLAIWTAIENNDLLAAALARLLLFTDPYKLPSVGDVEGAWQLYLRTWRPGAYTRGDDAQKAALRVKWSANYSRARSE